KVVDVGVEAVASEVLPGERDRVRVLVDAEHPRSASQRGVHAEAAGEAETVEDAGSARQPAHQGPVLALIEEEAGLLSPTHVDAEAHSPLLDHDRVGGLLAPQELGATLLVAVLARDLVAPQNRADAGERPERLDQHPPRRSKARRVELQHHRAGIEICYDA